MAEVKNYPQKIEIRKAIEEEKKTTPSKVIKALVDSKFLGTDFHPELTQQNVKELYETSGIKFGGIY